VLCVLGFGVTHHPLTIESINVDLVERLPAKVRSAAIEAGLPAGRGWLLVEMGGGDHVSAQVAAEKMLEELRDSGSPATATLVTATHCHQHAVMGFEADRSVMAAAGINAVVPDSVCCGLAGNIGFEGGYYEVSKAAGERPAACRARRRTRHGHRRRGLQLPNPDRARASRQPPAPGPSAGGRAAAGPPTQHSRRRAVSA